MLADLPPATSLPDTVNAVASDLGVNRPALVDTDFNSTRVDADACLRLDVGHETALALRADVRTGLDDGTA